MYAFPDFQQNFCLALGLIFHSLHSPQSRLAGKSRKKKLHAFFWVIPRRLNFICLRFGTDKKLSVLHTIRMWGGWGWEGGRVEAPLGLKRSSSAKRSERPWDPHSLLLSAYRGLFPPGIKGQGPEFWFYEVTNGNDRSLNVGIQLLRLFIGIMFVPFTQTVQMCGGSCVLLRVKFDVTRVYICIA